MKAMPSPSPFDFEMLFNNTGITSYFSSNDCDKSSFCEPISVLDSRIPSGQTYSSTPSSSRGGGSSAGGDGNPSPKCQHDSTTATSSSAEGVDSDLLPVPPSLADKCAMEDWESVLSESAAASPGQGQSNFGWIMGDVDDPAVGTLTKFLQFGGSTAAEFDFNGGFGVMDAENLGANFFPNFSNRSASENIDSIPIKFYHNSPNPMHHSSTASNFGAAFHSPTEFLPFSYRHEQLTPLPAKRLNSGGDQISKSPYEDARQQLNQQQQQLQFLPQHLHHPPKRSASDELQQAIVDELYTAAELLQAGNPAPAQGILARLNQHLSPSGRPFTRAAFYCKEALQLFLRSGSTNPSAAAHSSPSSLLFKIGAYKSFSEISPLIDFANFTCNQAILEAVEESDRIHIFDFDIRYGGQWASLMQELSSRNNGAPFLKITALVSPSTHNQLELVLARENLIQFANEINIGFEFQIMSIDSLSSVSLSVLSNEAEAVAVNIPASFLTNNQVSACFALGFVKQLSPRIVVSVGRGCDRADLPVAGHVVHAVEAYSRLLESLDAANASADALQKIERLLIQPEIEKVVMRRFRCGERSQDWRSVFVNCGFSPLTFSNFAEAQAELVVKKTSVGGFEVEKRQSSLVVCWLGKELLSVSVWRCSNL